MVVVPRGFVFLGSRVLKFLGALVGPSWSVISVTSAFDVSLSAARCYGHEGNFSDAIQPYQRLQDTRENSVSGLPHVAQSLDNRGFTC